MVLSWLVVRERLSFVLVMVDGLPSTVGVVEVMVVLWLLWRRGRGDVGSSGRGGVSMLAPTHSSARSSRRTVVDVICPRADR